LYSVVELYVITFVRVQRRFHLYSRTAIIATVYKRRNIVGQHCYGMVLRAFRHRQASFGTQRRIDFMDDDEQNLALIEAAMRLQNATKLMPNRTSVERC